MRKAIRITCGLMMLLTSDLGASTPKVNWVGFELPGLYGSEQKDGMVDRVKAFWEERLPGWHHNAIELLPVSRIVDGLINHRSSITILPMKTPFPPGYDLKLLRSKVVHLFPPPGIVMKKAVAQVMFPDGVASIETFLTSPQRPLLLWVHGATFHPALRKRVEKAMVTESERDQIHLVTLSDDYNFLAKMILHGRAEAYIDHAVSFQHSMRKVARSEDMVFLPLAEIQTPVPIYAFANKTPASQQLLDELNAILESSDYQDELVNLIGEYFPEEIREDYIKLNRHMFHQKENSVQVTN